MGPGCQSERKRQEIGGGGWLGWGMGRGALAEWPRGERRLGLRAISRERSFPFFCFFSFIQKPFETHFKILLNHFEF